MQVGIKQGRLAGLAADSARFHSAVNIPAGSLDFPAVSFTR
jgi:hypothetical protein